MQKGFETFFSKIKQKKKKNAKITDQNIKINHQPKNFSFKLNHNKTYSLILHSNYEVQPNDQLYNFVELIVQLGNQKKNFDVAHIKKKLHLEFYPTCEFHFSHSKMQQQICTICLCQFQVKYAQAEILLELTQQNPDDVYMLLCKHKFHLSCLKNLVAEKDWLKCPICSRIFGVMKGDQPEGTMDIKYDEYTEIPGHGKGAITIRYQLLSGVRNKVPFSGTFRTAYLPNNKEGKLVLKLLQIAFERKLIFTVGRSVTTGLDNQTVWNGIHHKTSTSGGATNFGYPDPTYLARVKEQLAAKGITQDQIEDYLLNSN